MPQLVLHTCQATLNVTTPADQRPMFPNPRARTIGQGNLIAGEELSQHLRVELVTFTFALGDDPQLLRMRQNNSTGQWLDQLNEPFVAGCGFHNDLESAQLAEPALDSRLVPAFQPLARRDLLLPTLFYHHAAADSLLVEVDADVLHGIAPFVETVGEQHHSFTTFARSIPNAARPPLS